MSMYNIISEEFACPRCGKTSLVEIECRFGNTNEMKRLHLGDKYPWKEGKSVKNGGKPKEENYIGEGYTDCPICKQDFFVDVVVNKGIITSVAPNKKKAYKVLKMKPPFNIE